MLEQIAEPLLQWFDENKRILPWRQDPTPYHVWISEIMLQQTRVEAVKSYYARFTEALPIHILAYSCQVRKDLINLAKPVRVYVNGKEESEEQETLC